MTLFSLYISTTSFWLRIPLFEIGIQARHSRHDAPYILINAWRYQVEINTHLILIKKANKGKPPIYTITHQWPAPIRVEIS